MALFVEKRKMHWPAASRSRFACKTFMELNWAIISRHAKGEMKFRLRLLLRGQSFQDLPYVRPLRESDDKVFVAYARTGCFLLILDWLIESIRMNIRM